MLLDGIVTVSSGWGILPLGLAQCFLAILRCCRTRRGWSPWVHAASTVQWPLQLIMESREPTTDAELAGDPDVDVVYVASPHHDHFSSAKVCLEAGKSVLVEKPLTTSPVDTEEFINLAMYCGLVLDGGDVDPDQPAAP